MVLRKPGKDDYSNLKNYRPIALLSTIGKALESVIAGRISYLVEEFGLLLQNYIGGRRGRSCNHALHLLLERTHAAWRAGDIIATLLTLDVSGAYNNVVHRRLIYNLRKQRIPREIVNWITSFLADRKTAILLAEGLGKVYSMATGISQGSPLSPILYLFYNADMIEGLITTNKKALVVGYMDDVCILTWSKTVRENYALLHRIHARAEAWEATHASKFSPVKYGLINITRQVAPAR